MRFLGFTAALASLVPVISALGQKQIISFEDSSDAFRLAGGDVGKGQILVSSDDYWGVIRAAGDLGDDFGRVTGTKYSLSTGEKGAKAAKFEFDPVDITNNTKYMTTSQESFDGPEYADPDASKTVVIVGTIGHSKHIDDMISAGKLDVSDVEGQWESFVTKVVKDPIPGCSEALVIAGSMPRGTIFGIYDISEQMGVSPWYFWADVPTKQNKDIFVMQGQKTQGAPSVKFRGFFLNDEQPALTNWVSTNWPDEWNGAAGYNHHFYALVCELLLRLRANYFWPAVWGTIFYTDDPFNQPLAHAYEVVLGTSHTEPMMRAQNEFGTYYSDQGPWAYNENNETIDEYFEYGVQRAKPYARNSLWTMAMRGTGDTAIEGGVEGIIDMLEVVVRRQQEIITKGLELDNLTDVPMSWCLYKEVQTYKDMGLEVPTDITLLWSDDNWGNIRRMPLKNETDRPGGAGVYYHFDYVGDPRDYKWINTIQLEKTAEQMHMAYAREADRIWIVNVGDLKPLEIPISHFMDLAYDTKRWAVDNTAGWVKAWVGREFGSSGVDVDEAVSLMTRFGMFAARRKFELVEPQTYSVLNYNEADAVMSQWMMLESDAEAAYKKLDDDYKPAFFQMILHPITAGRILNEIYISAAKNNLYAWQKRNAANSMADHARQLLYADSNLTMRWNELLDGKWEHMMDQTHLGYDGYWQQPMRNSLPAMRYVQETLNSVAGPVRVGVESSNASISGDDQFHPNSGNTLEVPPMDPYGPLTRYFDVFSAGTNSCDWTAAAWEPWVKLSKSEGTVGPKGEDSRVYISIDWDNAPVGPNSTVVNINVTTPCRRFAKYAGKPPMVQVPVMMRSVPSNFTKGFVESDGTVAIEGPHYQSIAKASSPSMGNSTGNSTMKPTYHTFTDYGRTLGGVGLYPPTLDKLSLEQAPALQYDMYLFSNDTLANVTLFLSPSHNYLSEYSPLEYAISLTPAGDSSSPAPAPKHVRYVGPTEGTSMPEGWGYAVADGVWGVSTNTSTTGFQVGLEGAYTLKVWCLMPSVIVQKVVVDLGGVRESYLGPPESFLMGRDEMGKYNQTSFLNAPGTLGGSDGSNDGSGSGSGSDSDSDSDSGSGSGSGSGSSDGGVDQVPGKGGAGVVQVGSWGILIALGAVASLML